MNQSLSEPSSFVVRVPRTLLVLLCGLAVNASVSAQAHGGLEALWNDPTFQKQFVGAYGINAEIEPRVTPEEVEVLEKIRPLMAASLPQAEATLRKLMKPGCSAVLDFTLGGIQFQQERLSEALASFRQAVTKFPSFLRAWRNLGLIHARNAEYDAAIGAFTRMIELGGGDAYSYGLLGYSYASKQDHQAAEVAYRNALLLQPDNPEWRLHLARSVLKQEKFEDAVALLNVLITRFPDKTDFWLLQAHAFLGLKRPLEAAVNFEVVDRLGKATVDSLFTLGDIYASETLLDLAAHAYRRAIQADPAQPIARALRSAEVMAARNAPRAAREVTMQITEVMGTQLSEEDRRKLLKLEVRLTMAEGTATEETVRVLEEVVTLDPLDGEALMLLGQHYSQTEPDRAIFYFERAASQEAYEAKAKISHAQVLVKLSRYGDALPLLRRAQEVKPREDVARLLEQVERLARSRS